VLKNEVLIVSAHYDHVGVMRGQIYNGADDNGSGTCCLLSLAEAIKQYGPMRRSLLLMWVCGEEKGLWGSEVWNKNPYLPEGCKPVADINIDMVGRNAPEKLLVTPTEKHKSYSFLTKVAQTYAAQEGFHGPNQGDPALGSADEYWTRSDHYNFVKAGIPACFLFSDVHEDYHQPTDDPEKIDYDKVHRAARLVLHMLDALQNDKIDG
jgi:Zn-dependent M28 family amino/carboxypeptidase